jgi:hypothetical protein
MRQPFASETCAISVLANEGQYNEISIILYELFHSELTLNTASDQNQIEKKNIHFPCSRLRSSTHSRLEYIHK